MTLHSYRDLIVWQKSMELVKAVYRLTSHYPASERFGLIEHTCKTAISIPSNIAEGRGRSSRKDFCRFLKIAYASGCELETQVELAKQLTLCEKECFKEVDELLDHIMRMLNKMTNSLVPKKPAKANKRTSEPAIIEA